MSKEEKYLIALGNLQNMAIDNTKGSKAVEICTNDIRAYVERLNNIIDELEKWLKHYIPLLEAGDIVDETTQDTLKEVLNKLNELKGDNK